MPFRAKTGSRGLSVTKNPYGYSIRISDQDPQTRYLPPDPKELERAVKSAATADTPRPRTLRS